MGKDNQKRTAGFEPQALEEKVEDDCERYRGKRILINTRKRGIIEGVVKNVSYENLLLSVDPLRYGTLEVLINRKDISEIVPKSIIISS